MLNVLYHNEAIYQKEQLTVKQYAKKQTKTLFEQIVGNTVWCSGMYNVQMKR